MTFLSKLSGKNINQDGEIVENEEVGKGTKIKVISALLVVGFAVYIAWWVQEPGDIRADVLADSGTSQTTEQGTGETAVTTESESSSMLAEAIAQVTQEISMTNFSFDPAEVTIKKGTIVTWVNRDSVPHTVTGNDFNSGTLDRGQSYSYTFNMDGSFDYYSSFYPEMTGTITVGTGGDASLTSESAVESMSAEMPPTDEIASMSTTEVGLPDPSIYGDGMGTTDTTLPAVNSDKLKESAPVLLTSEELMAQAAAEKASAEVHASAEETDKLASSGPEDFLYLGAFLTILFLKRRTLLGAIK